MSFRGNQTIINTKFKKITFTSFVILFFSFAVSCRQQISDTIASETEGYFVKQEN
jgi:hypothetical protein